MKKIIVSTIVIGLLLTTSIVSMNAISGDSVVEKRVSTDDEISYEVMPYRLSIEHEMESVLGQGETLLQGGGDVELLWTHSGEGRRVFSAFINDDDVPDILASSYAIDGITGETIYQFEAGKVIGVGDIDDDDIDEIITYKDGEDNNYETTIYCLNSLNGEIKWTKIFESTWAHHVSIGDIKGDNNSRDNNNKEIILCLGDVGYRNNHYIYCLDGTNGEIEWQKWTDGYPFCCEVSDVNNDGENEAIVSVSGIINSVEGIGYMYCLDGDGNELWNFSEYFGTFRHFCIDNLNDDSYKEILAEKGNGIRCLSGLDGSVLWNYTPTSHGSIQSIRTGDLISDFSGNEVVIGGVAGIYCLKGGDNSSDREIWRYYGGSGFTNFLMSMAIGDIDKDGLLDVAGITCRFGSENGKAIAVNGQDGSFLWKYDNCGINYFESSIICLDLTGDGYSEVIAKDNTYVCALVTSSEENNPPNKPETPSGPTSGQAGVEYEYTTSTTDPDGDYVKYGWDWQGDFIIDEWTVFYPSGTPVTVPHSWDLPGPRWIRVKAKDVFGAESDWSDPLAVSMPISQPSSQQTTPTSTTTSSPTSR